jgi:hypothetical protein
MGMDEGWAILEGFQGGSRGQGQDANMRRGVRSKPCDSGPPCLIDKLWE